MAYELKMPQLGLTMEEGTLSKWLKHEGDTVKAGEVVAEITATMKTMPQYDYEVILVNDCSPDDTIGTIRALVAADDHVTGVDLAKNFGQHAALMAGFHKCSGDIIVCLDDDGQTPADEVGKLLEKIDAGYDVVYASYDTKRQAGWRNLGSWANSKMTEIMLGNPPFCGGRDAAV